MSKNNIVYEWYESTGYLDAWRVVQSLDFDQYSFLIGIGGDGTFHEMVNGMLFREDGKILPLLCVPNGSGNDFCRNIGIYNPEQALQSLAKLDVINLDI